MGMSIQTVARGASIGKSDSRVGRQSRDQSSPFQPAQTHPPRHPSIPAAIKDRLICGAVTMRVSCVRLSDSASEPQKPYLCWGGLSRIRTEIA